MMNWIGVALSLGAISGSLAALWVAYRLGRVSLLKEQAMASVEAKNKAVAHKEEIHETSDSDLDAQLSKWVRRD